MPRASPPIFGRAVAETITLLPQVDPAPLWHAKVAEYMADGMDHQEAVNQLVVDLPDLWADYRATLMPVVGVSVAPEDVPAAVEFLALRRELRVVSDENAARVALAGPAMAVEG